MKRLYVVPFLMVHVLGCSVYDYNMHMAFKRGPNPTEQRIEFTVNNKEVFCCCGKKPVGALFLYGQPEYFCAQHMPEIEYVRPITKDNIEDLLRSLGSNYTMNGTHNGN
jgi:hypothetical protein